MSDTGDLTSVEGLPCETCAHLVERFESGRVMCQGVYRYVPKKIRTWVMRFPCGWDYTPTGKRKPRCSDYEQAKGQTRMEV